MGLLSGVVSAHVLLDAVLVRGTDARVLDSGLDLGEVGGSERPAPGHDPGGEESGLGFGSRGFAALGDDGPPRVVRVQDG